MDDAPIDALAAAVIALADLFNGIAAELSAELAEPERLAA